MEENRRKVAIDLGKANVFSVVFILALLLIAVTAYFLLWPEQFAKETFRAMVQFDWMGPLILMMTAGIVVHELIHGLTWACFAEGGWTTIKFGIVREHMTPYCHCNVPLRKNSYMTGAFMPCLVLGIIPTLIGFVFASLLFLFFGLISIASATGDLWMMLLLRKEKSGSLILDHPSEAGYYVIEN